MNDSEKYRYTKNYLWALMLLEANISIEWDEEGEQWVISDTGQGVNYGQGETPQEALNDYTQGVVYSVLIEQDYIHKQMENHTANEEV